MNAASANLRVGDDRLDRQYRAILSFDTQGIPDAAVLTAATVELRADAMVGTNPYRTHGRLLCDIKAGSFSDNSRLQALDFKAPATLNAAAALPMPLDSRWHRAMLDKQARTLVKPAGSTQIRLRFSRGDDNDRTADYLVFSSGNARSGARPRRELLYYVP